ncbi:MAG: hypothetical protein AB1592_19365 [Pseudomonadota bacterium]
MKHVAVAWLAAGLIVALAGTETRAEGVGGAVPVGGRTAAGAALEPRWRMPSVTLSGLTVWTFRPGHFVRHNPPASLVSRSSQRDMDSR